jgi:hypothetical protein
VLGGSFWAPPQAQQFFIEPDNADNARDNRDRGHKALWVAAQSVQ